MLYCSWRGQKSVRTARITVYGDVRNRLTRCGSGYLSLGNRHSSGRPVVVDDDQVEILIKNNQFRTIRDIGDIFPISHMNVML